MTTTLNKYIEIKNLFNPQKAFERLENEFIDIMYPGQFFGNSLIMLLDTGFDPYNEREMIWLKDLLDSVLPGIGETEYIVVPFEAL